MKTFTLFYAVYFFIVQGEPVTIKDDSYYYSVESCLESVDSQIQNVYNPILSTQSESFVTAVCMGRDFNNIGNL